MKTTEQTVFSAFLSNLILGERQEFKNMTLIPLFSDLESNTSYLTLEEAMASSEIEILEKSQSGSVPELVVMNNGDKKVLLVDAEEIAGAKQNRILNTSILLRKRSKTVIPVSCTESGRWNYQSEKFMDSNIIATPKIRRKKSSSVTDSLYFCGEHASDQGEVWNTVENFFVDAKMDSPTRAMKEVYDKKKTDVVDYMKAFQQEEGQRGFLILLEGKVIGMDYFSSPDAFNKLFLKVLRSYAIEAELEGKKTIEATKKDSPETFLERIVFAEVNQFKSPGHGFDHRFTGKDLTGNSLVYQDEVIHFAAFDNGEDKTYRRRNFR